MTKDEALGALAAADAEATAAETLAADKFAARRAAVRDAFEAGSTAPEICEVLGVSPQRAYQMRDMPLPQTA